MSGFLLLHYPPHGDRFGTPQNLREACARLRQSHPFSSSPRLTVLGDPAYACTKLDTDDSESSNVFRRSEDGSWLFTLGPFTYDGKRPSGAALAGLLADLGENPLATARRMNGVFAVVAFDSPRQRLLVIPNALGSYAVFVRRAAEGLIGVSSSLFALAALGPVTVDEFAFQSLHRCGHRLPPHTPFNEIRSLPEGSLIELRDGRCEVHRYWTPDFHETPFSTIADAAGHLANELTGYCTSLIEPAHPVFSDLTGGYDSRTSTACLIRGAIPFIATVTGSATHPDVLASRRICRLEQLPLQVVDPNEAGAGVSSQLDAAVLLTEGCVDAFNYATTLCVKRTLFATIGLSPVFTVSGAFGECYRDFYWAQEFFDRGRHRPASIEKLIRYRIDSSTATMDVFAQDWRDEWRERLRRYLEDVIAPYSGERNTAQIDVVYLRKLTGMIGAFSSAASRFSAPLLPFTSLPALDAALRVPPRWRYNSRLLRHTTFLLAPQLASHMTLSGCPCAPMSIRNWLRFLPAIGTQGERLIRKVSTVWLGKTIFPEHAQPAAQSAYFLHFLDGETSSEGNLHFDSMRTAGRYRRDALARLLLEARGPEGSAARSAIARIFTFERILRMTNATAGQPAVVSGWSR